MKNNDNNQVKNEELEVKQVEENMQVEKEAVSDKKEELNVREINKDKVEKRKINWKRVGIISGLLFFLTAILYFLAVLFFDWRLPNGCGFINRCSENECFKAWICFNENGKSKERINIDNSVKSESKTLDKNTEASSGAKSEIEKEEKVNLNDLEVISLGEINWLGKAEEVELDIINEEKNGIGDKAKISEVKYYKVANLSNDRKLYYMFYDIGIPVNGFLIILGDKNNYSILANEKFYNNYPGLNIFLENVNFVLVSEKDELKFEKDKEINYKGKILEKKYNDMVFDNNEDYELIGELEEKKLYKKYIYSDEVGEEIANRGLYVLFEDGFLYEYGLKSEIFTDDRVPKITWADGGRNDMNFEQRVLALGHRYYSVIPVVIDGSGVLGDKVKIGKLDIGEDVYQLKGVDNELVKQLWKSYDEHGGYSYGDEKEDKIESIEEFDNQINHFLMQDIFGDWQIFVNIKFAPAVEMGKPVIYLYPEEKMEVDVRVGASITKSDPIYPEGGWRNVLAKPNGDLIYQNKKYESLFWEGMGDGGYEFLKDKGEIVRGKEVIKVVTKQMYELGLNEKEIGDFMEFWKANLPVSENWVRLSWYQTQDLNEIAPLYINPKPDTLIRVFLDWEAVSEYKELKKQNLDKIERKGFTVVEWGGVLFR